MFRCSYKADTRDVNFACYNWKLESNLIINIGFEWPTEYPMCSVQEFHEFKYYALLLSTCTQWAKSFRTSFCYHDS